MTSQSAPREDSPLRVFLIAALRRPGQIGAVAPSSSRLAGVLASVVPRDGAPIVVELGPGSGAVSEAIAHRLPPGARHLAVEVDSELAAYLRAARPSMEVIEGDAVHLAELLAERGVHWVDAVVSGLPWALFGAATQEAILSQVARLLAPGGVFTTFAYLHGTVLARARHFREMLRTMFDEVLVTSTVWRNVPPAFAYVCRRPRVR